MHSRVTGENGENGENGDEGGGLACVAVKGAALASATPVIPISGSNRQFRIDWPVFKD
jgi:hypothetical protein